MIEKYLIRHCSPTLASLKTANLFTYKYECDIELYNTLEEWNDSFRSKGVKMRILRKKENVALIYVYRESMLKLDLEKAGVDLFLGQYGYEHRDIDYAIDKLSERINESESFPHEIGIFLSYPLADVIAFIENKGQNCKCVGCWKVYFNECEAIKKFARFKKCTEVYSRLWTNGKSILELSVAV